MKLLWSWSKQADVLHLLVNRLRRYQWSCDPGGCQGESDSLVFVLNTHHVCFEIRRTQTPARSHRDTRECMNTYLHLWICTDRLQREPVVFTVVFLQVFLLHSHFTCRNNTDPRPAHELRNPDPHQPEHPSNHLATTQSYSGSLAFLVSNTPCVFLESC